MLRNLLLTLSFLSTLSFGEMSYQHFSAEDGLPSDTVFDVLADEKGFIWFATHEGLARYDGHEFTNFPTRTGDGSTLWMSIWALTGGKDGDFWVGTWGDGLARYNTETENFTFYKKKDNDSSTLPSNIVFRVFQSSHNEVWCATYGGGLAVLNPNTSKVVRFQHDSQNLKSLSSNFLRTVIVDNNKTVWCGGQDGVVNRLDPETGEVTRFYNKQTNAPINCLRFDSVGKLWVGTMQGLHCLDPKTGEFIDSNRESLASLENVIITRLKPRRAGGLWVCTVSRGLFTFLPKTKELLPFLKEDLTIGTRKNNRITGAYELNQGEIWVSTTGGVDLYRQQPSRFKSHTQFTKPALSSSYITDLATVHGKVWLVTSKRGLNIFDPEDKTVELLTPDYDNEDDICNSSPTGVAFDGDDSLWISSKNGLFQYSVSKRKIVQHHPGNTSVPNSLGSGNLLAIAISPNGEVWLGSASHGLECFIPGKGVVKRFTVRDDGEPIITDDWVYALYFDSNGFLWAGTDLGISCINLKDNTADIFKHSQTDKNSLAAGIVSSIFEDSKGQIWVGTSLGISLFDKINKSFKNFSSDGKAVFSIAEDKHGLLWLGTNKGLLRFDSENGQFWGFGEEDGLSGKVYNKNAVVCDKNGHLYFGSAKGLNIYDGKLLEKSTFCPPVYLTELEVLNKKLYPSRSNILQHSMLETNSLTLPAEKDVFSLSFVALDYRAPKKLRYMYRLIGFDKNWIETSAKNRRATYTNMKPGKYTFMVKSTNSDGVWCNNTKSIEITILPPWWETWWFRSFCLFLIVFSILLVYAIRVKSFRRREFILESTVREKTKDLREMYQKTEMALNSEREAIKQNMNFIDMISHEYRTPLSVISLCTDVIDRRFPIDKYPELREQSGVIRSSCNRLVNIFENSLNESRTRNYEITANKQDIQVLPAVESAINYIKRIYPDYSISLDACLDSEINIFADRELIITAFCNILDNACKYSKSGSPITIVMEKSEGSVVFAVKDQGIGIKESEFESVFEKYYRSETVGKQQGTGVGLFLVKRIVELHDGTVSIASTLGKGTIIKVQLPVNIGGSQ